MSKRMFTKEQIVEMHNNPNVVSCSDKSITFSKEFKINAIRLYKEEYLSSTEIFRQAGFDANTIPKKQAKDCLHRWSRINQKKGPGGLSENRGKSKPKREPKTVDLADSDKIKRLETEVAYLRAENDFLAKLRAKRTE